MYKVYIISPLVQAMITECDFLLSELTKSAYEFQRDIVRTTNNQVQDIIPKSITICMVPYREVTY